MKKKQRDKIEGTTPVWVTERVPKRPYNDREPVFGKSNSEPHYVYYSARV